MSKSSIQGLFSLGYALLALILWLTGHEIAAATFFIGSELASICGVLCRIEAGMDKTVQAIDMVGKGD